MGGALFNQIAKLRIHFGSTASNIERMNGCMFEQSYDLFRCRSRHRLFAIRPGVDMTVRAGLIAGFTNVDLQHFDRLRPQTRNAMTVDY